MNTPKEHLMLKDENVHITVKRPNGYMEEIDASNIFVTEGLQAVANLISGEATVSPFKYMQIGVSSTAPVTTQTALVSEIESTTASIAIGTTNVSNDTINYTGVFAISTTEAIQEAGLFNNKAGSTTILMLARVTFPVINLSNGSQMTIKWKVVA
ncbi:MAG: hypothetical protein QXL94_01130 [Candidatus Parvarchaeum sp.]